MVMRATAFPATYNAGTWGLLTEADRKSWHHGVVGLYRKSMQKLIPFMELRSMSDEEVLDKANALTPQDELRVLRLRCYTQGLLRPNRFYWMILGQERYWLDLVMEDFNWMYDQIKGHTNHPPRHDIAYWNQFITRSYKRWQGLLKRACLHVVLQRRLRLQVRHAHAEILHRERSGSNIPQEQAALVTESFKRFLLPTYRGWAVHAFKKHGRLHP